MNRLANAMSEISPHNHWVYLVRSGKFLKIGISHNVAKRLGGIQTGNPLSLTLIRQWLTPHASKVEALAHKALDDYRLKGEWFDVPARAAVLTVSALVNAYPANPAAALPLDKTIVFCRACKRSGAVKAEPENRFKCVVCGDVESIGVIRL